MNGWERLAAELAKPENEHIDGYVGISHKGWFYGGSAYDGEPMEETALMMPVTDDPDFRPAFGIVADKTAGEVADLLSAYNEQIAKDRAEMEAEDDGG